MVMGIGNILVTGARGFMGSHLVPYLWSRDLNVLAFEGDLLDINSIRLFFHNHHIDQIVHLVGTFLWDLDQQLALNFSTTRHLLEVAEEFWVKKIIFTSSGAVYGDPAWEISYEDDICLPNTWYGLSKKFAEEIVEYYRRNQGFQTVILRFPNVYGAGSRGVIPTFLQSIREKGKLTIHGDGNQSRNFLHISDAIYAIHLAITYDASGIFNITNPVKVSLNELVSLLRGWYDFEVEYVENTVNLLRDVLLSGEMAREKLGFEPKQTTLLFE